MWVLVVVFCIEREVEIHMVESSRAYKLLPWRFGHERKIELPSYGGWERERNDMGEERV